LVKKPSISYTRFLRNLSSFDAYNEITAFPKLIAQLELKGTIVTTDALNTQKKAAAAIINQKADYALPVKENHKELYEDIKLLFEDADNKCFKGIDAAEDHTQEKSSGRIEERSYQLLDVEGLAFIQEWAGCLAWEELLEIEQKKTRHQRKHVFI
jgi:predicted transposase YbfD/YdcC